MIDVRRASFRCPDDRVSAREHLLNLRGGSQHSRTVSPNSSARRGNQENNNQEGPLGTNGDSPPGSGPSTDSSSSPSRSGSSELLGKLFDAPPRGDGRFLPHLERSLREPGTAFALRTPGGDFGHLLWLLQVLHREDPLTQATTDLVFRSWLDTPPRRVGSPLAVWRMAGFR